MFGDTDIARNHKYHSSVIDRMTAWSMFSRVPASAQSGYRDENRLRIGGVLGHRIDAEIYPKAASEKAQTTVSENRYVYPRINFFGRLFIDSSINRKNNARAPSQAGSYWGLPLQSCGRRVFTVFSPRLCPIILAFRPMIANLLCMILSVSPLS